MLSYVAPRPVRAVLFACALALVVLPSPVLRAQNGGSNGAAAASAPPLTPDYEAAAQWTSQKVSKLVFDTSVTPRWLENSDRFWYAYQTREGRKFYIVDPVKKAKAPLFDHVKMAATLTSITRIPYDAQHLPFTGVRFVKDNSVFEFDVEVPADANIPSTKPKITTTEQSAARGAGGGDVQDDQWDMDGEPQQGQRGQGGRGGATGPRPPRNKTLHFEYEMATGRVTLIEDYKEEPRAIRWASPSPDGKTVLFARNHNLFMMDAENFEKAKKNPNDTSIAETQLTKDGEEYYSFARAGGGTREQEDQQQQQQQQDREEGDQQQEQREEGDQGNRRVAAANVVWAQDSSRFALIRRDSRKVKDLWVINSLGNPRPTLETYRYAMPGEEHIPQSEMFVFDVAAKSRVKINADRFKDQSLSIAAKPQRAGAAGGRGGGGRGGAPQGPPPPPAQWLSTSPNKLYIQRQSRDLHRVDVAVADPTTGEVKTLIEERLNTYIETKPLRLANNETELFFWSERDGWGHYYLYDAATGALKNRVTEGEFVTTGIENIDEKGRVLYITAAGREKGEDPYYTHLYRVGFDGSGMKLLNQGNASHSTSVNEGARFFVNNTSRIDAAPESVLYDTLGNPIVKLETPDLSALMEMGFRYPEPFTVKADDGVTDLYGVMY